MSLQDLNPAQQAPPSAQGVKGRITIVCIADSLDREKLTGKLRERGQRFLQHSHADVLYGEAVFWPGKGPPMYPSLQLPQSASESQIPGAIQTLSSESCSRKLIVPLSCSAVPS